jgi:hypothetical protein
MSGLEHVILSVSNDRASLLTNNDHVILRSFAVLRRLRMTW